MAVKDVTLLRPVDFRDHPIWNLTEDLYNEDEVSPCDSCDPIPLEGTFYISACFKLADHSEFDGFIRLSEGTTMAIAIAINETEFIFFSLSEAIRGALGDSKTTFAIKIGKKAQEVFPLEYRTPFHFSDRAPIGGIVG